MTHAGDGSTPSDQATTNLDVTFPYSWKYPNLQREAAAPRIQVLGMVEIVIIISFIYLMVAKPGA